jgi:aspartate/methionine/tyrosine aminotransferase
MAFLNKGDMILAPNPGYPSYSAVAGLLEAKTIYYNLEEKNQWLPDLSKLEKRNLSRVKIMWVNYPHMPTGANGSHKLFDQLIAFGKRNNILIVNDNPYSFILNDHPKSILRHENAKEVCLELNSLSKTFNMAGWRVGMVCGRYELIKAVLQVKSNMDSGMFYGIQKGAIEALNASEMWFVSLNNVYQKRRELVWELATKLNCTFDRSASGLFVWAKLPPHFNSLEFADLLLKEHSIFVAPGNVFGSQGEGYIRFSLCCEEGDIEEALARIK